LDVDILLYILHLIGVQEADSTVYAQVEVSFTLLFIILLADFMNMLSCCYFYSCYVFYVINM